jgi:hypothetical protein
MAVELCKVSLWMEALGPGKPLSFLDHHIRLGNSLFGSTPDLISEGIPNDAFKPIECDDKNACAALKKLNARERRGFGDLFVREDASNFENLRQAALAVDDLADDTPEALRQKEAAFAETNRSYAYLRAKQLANAWCAAFIIQKAFKPGTADPIGITQNSLREVAKMGHVSGELNPEIQRLTRQYQLFHWPLEFPDAYGEGGFSVILGNPPWEKVKLQEKEWFAARGAEDIANAPNAAARKRLIEQLKNDDPALYRAFLDDVRKAEGESHLLRNSGLYPLCGRGDINLYAVFAEAMRRQLGPTGRMGAVLPSGIATDDTTKFFFQDVIETKSLASLYDFENKGIFPSVHSSYKFCLFTGGSGTKPIAEQCEFVFFAHTVDELKAANRRFILSREDISVLNPNTRTCPIFRSSVDAELTKAIYRRVPPLVKEGPPEQNPWNIEFLRMFDSANDSGLFRGQRDLEQNGFELSGNLFHRAAEAWLPFYEAKMAEPFDHRVANVVLSETATIRQGQSERLSIESHQNPLVCALPRNWISENAVEERLKRRWAKKWLIGWRDITAATNERTVICSLIPLCGASDKFLLMLPEVDSKLIPALYANLAALCFDFIARQKLGGVSLKYFVMKQLPVLPPTGYGNSCNWPASPQTLRDWLVSRVLELTYTAWDLEAFAQDCGWPGPPFRWDEERRFLLRCELDAAFFHLYLLAISDGGWKPARRTEGAAHDETPEQLAELQRHFHTPRDAVSYILDTFPILKRKDEAKFNADYRTKRVILEIYDALAESMQTGKPYQTRLDPPPADPRCCHPPRVS